MQNLGGKEKLRALQMIYHAAMNPIGENDDRYYVVNLSHKDVCKRFKLGVMWCANKVYERRWCYVCRWVLQDIWSMSYCGLF